MKKTVYIVLTIAILGFISCSAKSNEGTSDSKDQAAEVSKDRSKEKKGEKMKTIHLTKDEFLKKVVDYEGNPKEWKYLGDKPAIVDFYATWCGPCRAIAPILEELAEEYGGQIYIYKIDTDKEEELAGAFGIRSIPTLLFIPMDDQPQMVSGAMDKASFKKAIDEVLLKK